jgi:hypothetical protein
MPVAALFEHNMHSCIVYDGVHNTGQYTSRYATEHELCTCLLVRSAWSQMGQLSHCGNVCILGSPCRQQLLPSMASPTKT